MSSKYAAHRGTIEKLNSKILENFRIKSPDGKAKTSKQLERHVKGVANHHRIDIVMLVHRRPGVSVEEIATTLKCDYKTVSAHTQKLVQAGLLEKKYMGHTMQHSLSPYGFRFRDFLMSFK